MRTTRILTLAFTLSALLAAAPLSAADAPFEEEEKGDTIYLKNGRSLTGIVLQEGRKTIKLQTEGGPVVISQAQIKSIDHAPKEALDALKAAWASRRAELKSQKKALDEEREKRFKEYGEWVEDGQKRKALEHKEGEVAIQRDPESGSILVQALLNNDVKATLVLDTGAVVTIVSKSLGKRLGVDVETDRGKDVGEMHLPGGKTAKARMFILKSLSLDGIEEKDVATAVLLEENEHLGFKDGLLGRSFLNKFNIRLDPKAMKMTLKKINW